MRTFHTTLRLYCAALAVALCMSWSPGVYAVERGASLTASYSVPYLYSEPAVHAPQVAVVPSSKAMTQMPYTMTRDVQAGSFGGVKSQTSPRVARADTGEAAWRSSV